MAAGTGSVLGNGSTFTLSAGTVDTIISIDPPEETIEDVPDDHLGVQDYHELIPALVAKLGKARLTCIADLDTLAGTTNAPALGKVVTGTLTFNKQTGQTNGATYIGTGYLSRRKVGELVTDTRVIVEYEWQFDGKTGPAYTAGT